jgi:alkylation response protein AidB-like acyl-CoA dehydrogenase
MILNETQCAVRDPVRTFANEEIAPRAREFEKAGASPNSDGFHVDKVEHKLGQGASDTCAIRFDDVLVDERMRLGAEGASYGKAPANLEAGRIGIAAQCVGMARATLDAAIAYVRERKSFDSPIIAHQVVSFRLADLAAQLECLPRRAGLPDLRGHVRHSAHGDRMSAQSRRLGGRGLQICAGAPFAGASFALHALARRRRAADEIASDCANRRQTFGKTLIGHEGIGFMLADNLIDLKQAELMIDWCADVLDAGVLGTHESSMTKVAVSEALMRVADLCVQVVGGTGVSQDTIVEQVFREVRAFRIYDGPSEVHGWSLAKKIKWDWKAAHS